MELMPGGYKHMLGGPSLKVDVHTGALAEGVLTFVITLAVLWAIVKGPRNSLLKILIISCSTLVLVVFGGAYTGPAMNPANVIFRSSFLVVVLFFVIITIVPPFPDFSNMKKESMEHKA
jgi:glycerol uptake facilitator-like aquaporin